MSKNKSITWSDLSRYKKLSNRKKAILTNEFLTTFKNELINIFSKNGDDRDFSKETYWSFYSWVEESCGFDEALKNACKKHNLTKAIYEYNKNMEWYESDIFTRNITLLMVERGIIEKGEVSDNSSFELEEIKDDILEYKIVERKKGYNVVKYDWCFKDDFDYIESLYKDTKKELIWLTI